MAVKMLQPIVAQIDPARIAGMQRLMEVAGDYGRRLAKRSGNVKKGGMVRLVASYPDHGFVIDRAESREIFLNVRESTVEEDSLAELLDQDVI